MRGAGTAGSSLLAKRVIVIPPPDKALGFNSKSPLPKVVDAVKEFPISCLFVSADARRANRNQISVKRLDETTVFEM